jgi:hypothetical protein
MPRQIIPYTYQPGAYANPQIGAPSWAVLEFIAEDASNHSEYIYNAREVLLAWNKTAGVNDGQTLAATAGPATGGECTLPIVVNGVTFYAQIPFNATAAVAQAAILASTDVTGLLVFGNLYPLGVVVTGTAMPAGPLLITFENSLAGQLIAAIVPNNGGLIGDTWGITHTTPGSGQHNITLHSSLDRENRTQDIAIVIGGGCIIALPYLKSAGWVQSDGYIHVDGDNANVFWAVIENPQQ